MTKKKIRIGIKALLRVLDREINWLFVPYKRSLSQVLTSYPSTSLETEFWKEYYLSSVSTKSNELKRRGHAEIRETDSGLEVKITDRGRAELLKYDLENLKPLSIGRWDGQWRLVFFDVPEISKSKREMFRRYLSRLGMKPFQKSVYISPCPCEKEVKFIREILGVPNGVKIIVSDQVENSEELQEIFDI